MVKVDHNPAIIFDERGRLLRWVREPSNGEKTVSTCCSKELEYDDHNYDLYFNKQFKSFRNELIDNCEVR